MNNYNRKRDGKSGCFFKLLGDDNDVMVEVIAATIIFPDFGETIPNPETQVGTISMYYGSSDAGEFGID